MATQITSTGVFIKTSGNIGTYVPQPYILESSGGKYFIVGYDSTNTKIGVAMSTTVTGTYSIQDASNAGGGMSSGYGIYLPSNVYNINYIQSGDIIHIAYATTNTSGKDPLYGYHYERFDMSANSGNGGWVTSARQELATGYEWAAGSTLYRGIGMALRSDGDLIVIRTKEDGTSMGGSYSRLVFDRLESGSWTLATDLTFDQAAQDYFLHGSYAGSPGGMVFGAAGELHVVCARDTGTTNYYCYYISTTNTVTRVGYTGATSYYRGGAALPTRTWQGDETFYTDGSTIDWYFAPGSFDAISGGTDPFLCSVEETPTTFPTDYYISTNSGSSYNPNYSALVLDSSGGTAYLVYEDTTTGNLYSSEYSGHNTWANVDTDTGHNLHTSGSLGWSMDTKYPISAGTFRNLSWGTTGMPYVEDVTVFSSSQNITLTGDVTVSVVPASTFVTSQTLTGDVTVSVTPASTFAVASTFAGDVPISITVASDISYGPRLDGDVTVTFTPSASFAVDSTYTGDVTVTVSPASTYTTSSTLTGDVTISVTPASTFSSSQNLTGDLTVSFGITSNFVTSNTYTGDVTVTVTPAAVFAVASSLDKFRTSALDFRHANVGIRRTLPPADGSVDADDRATLLREYRHYTTTQNITLDGDVTVSVTPASTFAVQYEPVTGDVTVTVTPASSFVSDSVLAGDVTVSLSVASTFQVDSTLTGDVTVSVVPAASFQSSQLLTGDVTVTLSPASSFVVDSVLAGAVEVTVTPSSSFVSSHTYTTDVTVTVTPASSFQVNNEVTLVGDVTVTVAPAASFQNTSTLTGDITVSVIPASTFVVEYAPLTGDVPITVVPGSAFTTATTLTGDVTIQVVPGSTFSVGYDLTGDVTVLVVPASDFAVEYAQSGDVTITIAPASAFQTGATVTGDVPITVTPASSFAVAYAWTGDVPITVTPSSVISYTPAGVEFAKYITIVMRDARSLEIGMRDGRSITTELTDGRSV